MSPTSTAARATQAYIEVVRPQATEVTVTQAYVEVVSNNYSEVIAARPRFQAVIVG